MLMWLSISVIENGIWYDEEFGHSYLSLMKKYEKWIEKWARETRKAMVAKEAMIDHLIVKQQLEMMEMGPVGGQMEPLNCPPGLEYLTNMDYLILKLEMLESKIKNFRGQVSNSKKLILPTLQFLLCLKNVPPLVFNQIDARAKPEWNCKVTKTSSKFSDSHGSQDMPEKDYGTIDIKTNPPGDIVRDKQENLGVSSQSTSYKPQASISSSHIAGMRPEIPFAIIFSLFMYLSLSKWIYSMLDLRKEELIRRIN